MPDAFYSIRGYSYSLLPSFHLLGKEVRFRLGTMVQTLKFPCITLFTNRNTKEKLSTEYTICLYTLKYILYKQTLHYK